MCCCWMSPPTISMPMGSSGCRAGWIVFAAPWCSSPTIAICWIGSPVGLWRWRGARPAAMRVTTPPIWPAAPKRRRPRSPGQPVSGAACVANWPGCARAPRRAAPSRKPVCSVLKRCGSSRCVRPRQLYRWVPRPGGWANAPSKRKTSQSRLVIAFCWRNSAMTSDPRTGSASSDPMGSANRVCWMPSPAV